MGRVLPVAPAISVGAPGLYAAGMACSATLALRRHCKGSPEGWTNALKGTGWIQVVVATPWRRVVAMAGRRRSDWALWAKSPSPGRPGVARREDRRCFWTLNAAGQSSWDAAIGVGVSEAVGSRWFREAGGMPPSTLRRSSKPPSGRHLSLSEREGIALWRAQGDGVGGGARRLGGGGAAGLPAAGGH